jgi:class 3 adenylate cyclase
LIQKYNGYEIKTIGDAFMVAFHQALDALNFTLSLYDNTGHERIQIRAGIHVGPITIEEKDAFGSMVNFTARVQSHGRDAEIWVSSRAKDDIDLEKAKAHKALEWTKHPNCTLKGFPGKFILWSVLRPK